MPSEDQQALRLRLVYFMRRLFFSVIIAITIFVQPLSLFAADMDVTPSQYKVGKFFASKFCEAREDGLSLESAFDFATDASVWNRLKSGAILDLFKDENENEEVYNAQMIKFAFSKIQKDCPIPEEFIARLDSLE